MTSPARRPLERVVICGAGAVGSAYAALLHDLAPDRVALVADGARRAPQAFVSRRISRTSRRSGSYRRATSGISPGSACVAQPKHGS